MVARFDFLLLGSVEEEFLLFLEVSLSLLRDVSTSSAFFGGMVDVTVANDAGLDSNLDKVRTVCVVGATDDMVSVMLGL